MNPTTRLRPLNVGDLFDAAIRLYRAHFFRLIAITVLVYVPSVLLRRFIPIGFGRGEPIIANALWSLMFGSLLNGVLVHASARAYLGQPISVFAAYRSGVRHWITLIFASIIPQIVHSLNWPFAYLLTGAGYGTFFLLGTLLPADTLIAELLGVIGVAVFGLFLLVLIALLYGFVALVPQAVMLEGRWPLGALARSWRLVRGESRRVLVVVIATGILSFLFGDIPRTMLVLALLRRYGASFILINLLGSLGALLGQIVLQPLLVIIFTLLYYDLRMRKEGYDLELLAQQAALR
jgi:hypothetical protein